MRRFQRVGLGVVLTFLTGPVYADEQGVFVAGTQPSERPANAPVVENYDKGGAWYARALSGVSKPYPYSLRFLEDQGGWFNPFIKPGMTGPYDIRGWH
ncbi:hypothetical protein [Marimonas arenosa]|uniref:Uncharacterized protein n=1 Tax=Marimonas arenosa TaxID=1795305 RepID=A0AAE3WC57_9RHOB|nr:hypothetical protein [Marimonas arenosa]MDQ2088933.1 hypothetical protein [Marimonas arenosa]